MSAMLIYLGEGPATEAVVMGFARMVPIPGFSLVAKEFLRQVTKTSNATPATRRMHGDLSALSPPTAVRPRKRKRLLVQPAAIAGRSATRTHLDAVRSDYELMRGRLLQEISALTRRGNLNLVIGSAATAVAAGILAIVALKAPDKVGDLKEVMPQYVLRISLAIFVEVFSFFFLRLYRSSLSDIKYFQNELTNVELKFVAYGLSVAKDDPELAKAIVTSLLATERNFILKQGDSTVDLEQAKVEGQNTKQAVDALTALAKAIKGKDG